MTRGSVATLALGMLVASAATTACGSIDAAGGSPAGASGGAVDGERTYLALDAAEARLRLHDGEGVRRNLDAVPPDRRGLEWHLLDAAADGSDAAFALPGDGAFRVAWSSDGGRLAAACGDGRVRILDAATGAIVSTLPAGERPLFEAVFDGTGSAVVACGEDGAVRCLPAGGGPGDLLWKHDVPVASVDISPDGGRLAVSTYRLQREPFRIDGMVRVLALDGSTTPITLTGGIKPVVVVRWSPDGARIAACTWDGLVHVWTPVEGAEPLTLEIPDEGVYNAADGMAWSPDGARIAVGGKDRTVRVFDAAGGPPTLTLRGHDGPVTGVAWNPQGDLLATASMDGTLRLWSGASLRPAAILHGHRGPVTWCSFSADGRLASCSLDGTVRLWRAEPRLHGGTVDDGEDRTARCLAFSRDGGWRVEGRPDGVRLRDAVSGAVVADLAGPSPNALAVSPDGRWLAGTGEGGRWALWDLEARRLLREGTAHEAQGLAIAFAPDGRSLFSGGQDGSVRAVDADTGATLWTARPDGSAVRGLVAGSREVSVVTRGGGPHLLESASGLHLHVPIPGPGGGNALAGSPDGRYLAWSDESGRVFLRDGDAGTTLSMEGLHPAKVASLVFDGSGTRLISLSTVVRIHEVATGRRLVTPGDLGDPGWSVALSPDGSRIAACSWGGAVREWSTVPVRNR